MKKLALPLALVWCSPLWANPPVVPAPVTAAVGEDVQVTVTVEAGKKGAYGPGFDTADCLFFRGYSDDPAVMSFLVRPKKPGVFRTVFWTVGEGAYSTLVVDATGPTPVPPTPTPTPPVPADPFTATLQAAYTADTGTDKAVSLAFLKSAYTGMAANVKPGLTNNSQGLGWLQSVVAAPGLGLTPSQLAGMRHAIADHLATTFGTGATTPLDPNKFQAGLTRIASALAGVH